MNNMRYRGWIRLGIVLSVAWLIVFWSYSAILYQHASPFNGTWLFDQVPDESRPVMVEQDHKLIPVKSNLRIGLFLLTSLLPIVLGWLLVAIIVSTVNWIRRGFQDKEHHNA